MTQTDQEIAGSACFFRSLLGLLPPLCAIKDGDSLFPSCFDSPVPTLLLADDSALIRTMVKRILHDEPKIVVLGEAENFKDAIEKAAELKPDIVLLDLHMPDDETLQPEYIKSRLRPHGSTLKIVGMSLTGDDDSEARELGASLGACTVLDKARFEDELITAILSC